MALSRFFGRGRDQNPSSTPVDASVKEMETLAGDSTEDDQNDAPELAPERTWHERAEVVLPTGASTGSKRASALYGEHFSDLPTHFWSARGAHITDVDGNRYLDCTMALGSVALGYAEPRVVNAVVEAATQGNVSAFSSWREVELAERLCAMIPCAERAQFLKSGAEAVSAAVRIARTYTGRSRIITSGYFGWHDWSSDVAGVPAAVRADVTCVAFDDVAALEAAVQQAGPSLAAIVLEPVVEHAASNAWLERARALCDAAGAALIFDEIKTGFRVASAGWQEVSGVTPDLATYGKAMANGYPIAAVVGSSALMDAARQTWISSTLASESTALAAALAVLDWHDEADICAALGETGAEMRAAVERAIAASGIEGVTTDGIDQMWMMRWESASLESRFVGEAMRNGVLFKRGAYNFAAIAHDEEALRTIEAAASAALVALHDAE